MSAGPQRIVVDRARSGPPPSGSKLTTTTDRAAGGPVGDRSDRPSPQATSRTAASHEPMRAAYLWTAAVAVRCRHHEARPGARSGDRMVHY
jgi:hypothetical protein